MSWNEDKLNLFQKELEKLEKRKSYLEEMLFNNFLSEAFDIERQMTEKIKHMQLIPYPDNEYLADKKRYDEKFKAFKKANANSQKYMNELVSIDIMMDDIANEICRLEQNARIGRQE